MSRKDLGEKAVKDIFGGALYQQGRGFYVALELFAITRGLEEAGEPLLPDWGYGSGGGGVTLRYRRRSHDFARRLLADPAELSPEQRGRLAPGAESTLRALLAGLTVPIPGMKAEPAWWNRHFLPYVGELVHYDAVMRKRGARSVSIERYTYRGGGSLAYLLLAADPDAGRVRTVREGLRSLVASSDSQLARLARDFARFDSEPQDKATPPPFEDEVAQQTRVIETRWAEMLRAGVEAIVSRAGVVSSRRVDALMHFVPLCIAMHELECADRELGHEARRMLVFDTGVGTSAVRRLAREDLAAAVGAIYEALGSVARRSGSEELLRDSQSWRDGPRSFFTTTLGTVGALNALVGQRHFKLSPPLVEALVLALVRDEVTFDRFLEEELFGRLGFVVDGRSADRAGRAGDLDRAVFDRNADGLESTLQDLGLLRKYSDATRMVSTREL